MQQQTITSPTSQEQGLNESDVLTTYSFLDHKRETEIRMIDPATGKVEHAFIHDAQELLKVVRQNNGKNQIYIGINERKPSGTKTEDVLSVKTAFIDFDPVRTKNTNSTEEELLLTAKKAQEVADYLVQQGFKHPAFAMSGNGIYLAFALPEYKITDENRAEFNEKMQAWQRDISKRFSDEKVHIDNMGDLPRIIKIVGVLSIKGNHTAERPQRISCWRTHPTRDEDEALLRHILGQPTKKTVPIEEGKGIAEPQLTELFKGVDKLARILKGDCTGYHSRSEAEMFAVNELVRKGLSRQQIWSVMNLSKTEKWNEQTDSYREHTYEKALEFVAEERKQKELQDVPEENGKEVIFAEQNQEGKKPRWTATLAELKTKVSTQKENNLKINAKLCIVPYDNQRVRIIAQRGNTKNRRVLATIAHVKTGRDEYEWKSYEIGKKIPRARTVWSKEYVEDFWEYTARKDDVQILILSKEQLEPGEVQLRGYEIEANSDEDSVGNLKLSTFLKIFIVYDAKAIIPKLTTVDQIKEYCIKNKVNYDGLVHYLLYHPDLKKVLRQPKDREHFLLTQLLSGKKDGYALHSVTIADAETGKTVVGQAVQDKMAETQKPLDASTGTIKGLVPSFQKNVSPGYLLVCLRLAVVDELFRVLSRIDREDRAQIPPLMNTLLDQSESEHGTGTGQIRARMKAKLMATTNFLWGDKTLPVLLKHIDPSWISRVLIVYAPQAWADWVHEGTHTESERKTNLSQDEWLAIYDGCNSFTFEVDENITRKYLKQLLTFLPQSTDETSDTYIVTRFFKTRQLHHLYLLVDGFAKLRLVTQPEDFTGVNDADYISAFNLYSLFVEQMGIEGVFDGKLFLPKYDDASFAAWKVTE